MTSPTLFTTMTFADADTAIAFLTAIGFEERLVVREADGTTVAHAEFLWREAGGVMFGSARGASEFSAKEGIGIGRCYLVTESDEGVDALYERALAAGATGTSAPYSPDYGGRAATFADSEGNLFAIGSYPGA